jgi:hypothetical protein
MRTIQSKLTLSAAAIAAALLLAPGSGVSGALGPAAAAPIGPQAGIDAGPVVLAKDKGIKCCGGGGGGGIPPGPGNFKPGGKGGGGGKGDKGGKGGGWNHNHGVGLAIGGAIVLGMGYCAAQSERCEDEYGEDTGRYWRCMRRAGCSD